MACALTGINFAAETETLNTIGHIIAVGGAPAAHVDVKETSRNDTTAARSQSPTTQGRSQGRARSRLQRSRLQICIQKCIETRAISAGCQIGCAIAGTTEIATAAGEKRTHETAIAVSAQRTCPAMQCMTALFCSRPSANETRGPRVSSCWARSAAVHLLKVAVPRCPVSISLDLVRSDRGACDQGIRTERLRRMATTLHRGSIGTWRQTTF
jgi:hypothetical protein